MASQRTLTDLEITQRRTKLVELRANGQSWSTIAKQLNYSSPGAACTDLKRALELRRAELAVTLDEYRQLELEHLEHLQRTALDVLAEDTGDDQRLQAVETLRRLSERRAKLLGLDAPTRIESDGELRVIVEGVNVEELK